MSLYDTSYITFGFFWRYTSSNNNNNDTIQTIQYVSPQVLLDCITPASTSKKTNLYRLYRYRAETSTWVIGSGSGLPATRILNQEPITCKIYAHVIIRPSNHAYMITVVDCSTVRIVHVHVLQNDFTHNFTPSLRPR